MKKSTKIILWLSASLLALLMVAFSILYFVLQVPLFDRSGWQTTQQGQCRYLDYYGRSLKRWQTIENERYYFDPQTGFMHTGWLDTEEGYYYLRQDGTVTTGWLNLDTERYYFDNAGIMHTGWLETDGQRYYLGDDGVMQTGWLALEDRRYFLDESGVPTVGWLDMEDGRRYFDQQGRMQTGWMTMPEGEYLFGDTGLMQTGWQDTDRGQRFFDSCGLVQENFVQTETGVQCLQEDGTYLTGWLETETGLYYFDDDAVMRTGWITDEKGRFYLYEDGSFATGFVEIDGVKRYFTSNGEYIILCNRWNPVPDDYELNLVNMGSFKLDASCYDAMKEMMDAGKAEGITIRLNSTYRSKEHQQSLWEERRAKCMEQGMTWEEADEYVGRSVAVPGTSEHHTGLAADLAGADEMFQWLAENSWKYGFILRYPEDKTDITGIIYERWHFRYVGKDMARDIFDSGLCMEEYFLQLEKEEA